MLGLLYFFCCYPYIQIHIDLWVCECVYISQIDISLQIPHECATARLSSVCATQSRQAVPAALCKSLQLVQACPRLACPGLALGASYSVPVYLLSRSRLSPSLALVPLRQVIVSAIRVVFVLFVFVYFLPLLLLCLARRFLFYAWHHGFLCYFFLVSFFSTSPVYRPPACLPACFRFISLFPADFMAPAVRRGEGVGKGERTVSKTDDGYGNGEAEAEDEASARP